MRPIKVVLWVLAGLVGLVVVGLIAVVLLVDPNDFKDEIAQAVRDETGRELDLKGDLKLSVFPWLAIEVGHAELGNAPGFGATPFLTVERADVGVRLIPLLRGEMQVRRLELDGLRVNLIKNADGRTNWQDLTEPKPGAAAAPAGGGELPSIAGVEIKNSALDYRDLGTATHKRIEKLDVETGRFESGEPVDLQVEFAVDDGEGTPSTFVRLKTEATLDTQAERYSLKDLDLNAILPGEAQAADTQRDVAAPRDVEIALRAPSLVADLKAQTLALPQFVLNAYGAELSGGVEGKQIVDEPAFNGTIALKPVSPRELLKQFGGEAPRTRDPDVLKALAFEAKLAATGKSAMLRDLEVTLDDTKATGTAGIAAFDKTALRFDLAIDAIDVDRYLAPEEEQKKENPQDRKPFELPVERLKALDAQGKLRIGQLKLAGLKMSGVLFTVDARNGLVRVNPSQAKLYGGAHRGGFALDARGDTARLSIDEQLTSVAFAPLFKDLFDSERLAGKGNLKAVLAARGNDSDQLMRTLDGQIEFDVQDGALKGADLWYELRRARALWERQPPPAQASTGETKFHKLQGTAVVRNGVMENKDLTIDADYLKIAGEGKLEIPTQKVDYRLVANVFRVPPEGAGAEMQSLEAAEIPVRVSGTLEDLKIRPDLEAQAKARAREKIEEKKQELTEKLSDKLGDFFGRKKKQPSATPQ